MLKIFPGRLALLPASVLVLGHNLNGQEIFTVGFGSSTQLVSQNDTWHFHKGTNAPTVGWQTNADATLDNTWAAGQGGFGYADNSPETAQVKTPLPDMLNRYTTVYIRRSFEVSNVPGATEELQLTMDWDDGFVAWLDGAELSPRMFAPGGVGTEPAFNATASGNHESSLGNASPQTATTFSLGAVGNRLGAGTHVLAILGLNQATNSSDFILVPNLVVGGLPPGIVSGPLLSIVKTNAVSLSGSNTFAGSARVVIDGAEASFDPGSHQWSSTVALNPGFNRLLLQVLDTNGVQLFVTNKDIVLELNSVELGGQLGNSTSLSNSSGVFHITNSVAVPAGGNLSIGPGCVLLFSPGADLLATNATVTVAGSESAPVLFGPRDGGSVWGGLEVAGTSGVVAGQHMEVTGGHMELLNGAHGIFEDSYFHDYAISSPSIIHTLGTPAHCSLTLKRCHIQRYHEILSQMSTNDFQDCLMEYQQEGGDGIDFDAGQPGSVIRHCTVRHGLFTNVDALDMGEYGGTGEGSKGVLIDSCLVYDFVDKGVSMGVQVDVTVTNCLIHDVDSAIAVKDLSVAGIYNCTLVSNLFGFNCYNKANPAASTGGGFITNSFNNILWGNAQTIALANGSTLSATYSDFQGTNYPGIGNVNVEPLWINPAGDDYRLSTNSPLLEAGKNGGPMGAAFPVGAAMASSHPVLDTIELSATNAVLRFWADSEKTYSVLASDSLLGNNWTKVDDVFTAPLPHKVSLTNGLSSSSQFYRLVSPRQL